MKKYYVFIIQLSIVTIWLFSISVNGQIDKKIDSLVTEYAKKGFNGNVLYSKNGSILFTGNYGFSDMFLKQELNDSTLFELASVSKQFTALAIVQLEEKQLLNYKSKVSEIIIDFPYKNISIEHLLRHQSGLPDYQKLFYDKKNWNRKTEATNQDVLIVLNKLKLPLDFEPGSQYKYNNTGYIILALLLEKLSNMSYSEYINTFIFKPAEMKTAQVYDPNSLNNYAKGHTFNKRKKKYQYVEKDPNHKHIHWLNEVIGDRGIYASILDLEQWKKALRNNILISKESKKRMFLTDSISKKYGFGLAIYQTKNKGKWIYHNGSWSGYKTSAIYLPKTNEYLVILSNNRYKETYKKLEEDLYKSIH